MRWLHALGSWQHETSPSILLNSIFILSCDHRLVHTHSSSSHDGRYPKFWHVAQYDPASRNSTHRLRWHQVELWHPSRLEKVHRAEPEFRHERPPEALAPGRQSPGTRSLPDSLILGQGHHDAECPGLCHERAREIREHDGLERGVECPGSGWLQQSRGQPERAARTQVLAGQTLACRIGATQESWPRELWAKDPLGPSTVVDETKRGSGQIWQGQATASECRECRGHSRAGAISRREWRRGEAEWKHPSECRGV